MQSMSVDVGHDIKIVLENGEQFLLENLSPAGWLGRIYPVPAESPFSRGRGRGSDDSAPISTSNTSTRFQKGVASGLFIVKT